MSRNLKGGVGGGIPVKSLECQPGDILEYVDREVIKS